MSTMLASRSGHQHKTGGKLFEQIRQKDGSQRRNREYTYALHVSTRTRALPVATHAPGPYVSTRTLHVHIHCLQGTWPVLKRAGSCESGRNIYIIIFIMLVSKLNALRLRDTAMYGTQLAVTHHLLLIRPSPPFEGNLL